MFAEAHSDFERLLPIFDNVHVENRHFCVPVEWFEEDHTFPEKNALYVEHALDLSEKAARRALDKAGAEPEEIGAIFFVSTTGISTPSLDSKLIFRLGLSEHTRRVPIWGLGCSAGAAGLARAAEYARLYPDQTVLLVGVELSGLTFQRGDRSKSNLVSTSLFADGAAAVLLGGPGATGPEVLGSYSTTWPDTEDVMGWELVETGLKVQLSKSVPTIVQERFRRNLKEACDSLGVDIEELEHFVLHPGGAKVLDAFEEVLGHRAGRPHLYRDVLRDCGNMSSVTVLFILERFLAKRGVRARRPRRSLGDGAGLLRGARVFQMLKASAVRLSFRFRQRVVERSLNVVLLVVAVVMVAVQRLLELRYSRRNERRVRARGAVERGRGHYPVMVGMHALWLVSTLVEGLLRGPGSSGCWPVPLAAFLLVQPCGTGRSSPWGRTGTRGSWSFRDEGSSGAALTATSRTPTTSWWPWRYCRYL